jgi:glycosyltransferase involved in cell wall biosynthesis
VIKKPLLSIIIPTKNGHKTIIYAIDSIIRIQSYEIEIIIQDCSNNDSLRDIINIKFNYDKRIKYFYSSEKLSMIQNWDLAISNTTGKIIYGIGDDDAVLPSVLEIANWMDSSCINAVTTLRVQYIWNDAYLGTFANSRLTLPINFNGEIFSIDLNKEYFKKIKNCGFGYNNYLPNIYHGFISKKILDLHKSKTNYYLSGTSMDVYTAFVLPVYLKDLYYIDYPASILGASGKSNSNRFVTNKSQEHFKEFKNYNSISFLPKVFNAEVSITETTIQALIDTNQSDLIKNMNLALIYAKCASFEPFKLFKFYKSYLFYKNCDYYWYHFFISFIKFYKIEVKQIFLKLFVKYLLDFIPNSQYFIERLTNNKKPKCNDITECLNYINMYQIKHNKIIHFQSKIKSLHPRNEIWE